MNNDAVKLLPLPGGYSLKAYTHKTILGEGEAYGLERPSGGFIAEGWTEALATDFAAAIYAPTPREQELMALVEMCERALEMALGWVPETIRNGDNPKGLCPTMYHTCSYEGDARHIELFKQGQNALAAIQKAKGV